MKKARKGFTLVELLIVVAILATLTATMTYSISGSTAKAKASAIASNVEALKGAVALYVVNNASDGLKTMKTDDVLRAAMPKWADFSDSGATTGVKYTPDATAVSPENWVVTVDFYAEPERDDIRRRGRHNKSYCGKRFCYYNRS